MITPCLDIAGGLGQLFTCEQVNEYVRIRTPYLYPDGDVIDLFYRESTDGATVTDLGESLRWLRGQSITAKMTPKQRQLVQDIRLTHGVELYRGMLVARAHDPAEVAAAVVRVAQAALRVADLWFTFRLRQFENVTDEVAEFLEEREVPFDRGEKLIGRSGRPWTIPFHTRTPKRSALVTVLSTGSRGAARGIVDHNVAAWYDLNHLKAGPEGLRFVSLFDDTLDVWTEEDFRLLEDLSDVTRWSAPEQFLGQIAA